MNEVRLLTKFYELVELIGKDEVYALLERALKHYNEELNKAHEEWEHDKYGQQPDFDREKRKDYLETHPEAEDDEEILHNKI
jgi:hypothetical protein